MRYITYILTGALLALTGCATQTRIAERNTEFAALDPATQRNIQRGIVEPGYSTDMVYMALGQPAQTNSLAAGDAVWTYFHEPVTGPNETIQNGFRRRVVYDPEKRSNDVIIEPIDTKAFPNLVPYTLRLTFRAGKLANIERINRG
jgi:hypothetical protein